MSAADRFVLPAIGNFADHLRLPNFYQRQWHAVEGAVLDTAETNRLADIDRALHGVVALATVLAADARARDDLEVSEPDGAGPVLLGDSLRSDLLDAQDALLLYLTFDVADFRERLEKGIKRQEERRSGKGDAT